MDTWSSYSWYLGPYREQVCAEIRRFGQKRKETLCFKKKTRNVFFFKGDVWSRTYLLLSCFSLLRIAYLLKRTHPDKFLLRPICSPVFRIPIFFYPVFRIL